MTSVWLLRYNHNDKTRVKWGQLYKVTVVLIMSCRVYTHTHTHSGSTESLTCLLSAQYRKTFHSLTKKIQKHILQLKSMLQYCCYCYREKVFHQIFHHVGSCLLKCIKCWKEKLLNLKDKSRDTFTCLML